MPEGPAPVDWEGRALDCASCRFRMRLDLGQCGLGWSCLNDRYAKRIERFFLLNPELADENLNHPYFETRVNAARHASVFRIPRLLDDPDPAVRAMAILRLPQAAAEKLIHDPDRAVRIAVAHRLPPASLIPLMHDVEASVRLVVARRAPDGLLPGLIDDPDPSVRRIVVNRIPPDWIDRFRLDPDPLVRRAAAHRRPMLFVADDDIRVRHACAEEGCEKVLARLLDDPEDIIRETARARLAKLEGSADVD
ncbi:4Fe4S-binding leucine-rich repeat protein [Rhodobacter lacus]|uniref:4Fe4S-binding leucine-rich repeat protein n=1 Tax=Rhodobacter lacus TaxID=1641972 RepID=A0ABW5AD56_9RHOB